MSHRLALPLPPSFRTDDVLAHIGRDPESPTQRVDGRRVDLAVVLGGEPALLRVHLGARRAEMSVETRTGVAPDLDAASDLLVHLLGLHLDPGPFERHVEGHREMTRLVARRPGLTIPQTRDLFQGCVWVVAGQQVTLGLAYRMRRRLIEARGRPLGDLVVPPGAKEVATMRPDDLRALGFSRAKSEYLVGIARLMADGTLDPDELATLSPDEAEARLLAVRGLGRWSVHYLLMRSLGHEDAVPVGDAGLSRALQYVHGLDHRPKGREVEELMEPYAPYRSLATFHLWASLAD